MRRFRLCLCAAVPVVAIALAWAFWPESDPVQEKFARVKIGWTRAEVENVMGKDAETWMGREFIHLCFHGKNGTGQVEISRHTERVMNLTWIPPDRDPVWLRLWHLVMPPPPPSPGPNIKVL